MWLIEAHGLEVDPRAVSGFQVYRLNLNPKRMSNNSPKPIMIAIKGHYFTYFWGPGRFDPKGPRACQTNYYNLNGMWVLKPQYLSPRPLSVGVLRCH